MGTAAATVIPQVGKVSGKTTYHYEGLRTSTVGRCIA